jgi:hypothetical protein
MRSALLGRHLWRRRPSILGQLGIEIFFEYFLSRFLVDFAYRMFFVSRFSVSVAEAVNFINIDMFTYLQM